MFEEHGEIKKKNYKIQTVENFIAEILKIFSENVK